MRYCIVGGGILGLALARLDRPRGAGRGRRRAREGARRRAAPDRAQQRRRARRPLLRAGLAEGAAVPPRDGAAPGLLRRARDRRTRSAGRSSSPRRRRELERLGRIHERAVANGVPDVAMIDGARLRELEPHAAGIAALHSPRTAIVDFGAVARALAAEVARRRRRGPARRRGRARRRRAGRAAAGGAADGMTVEADAVVVCAGLHADRLARASGQPADPRIVPVPRRVLGAQARSAGTSCAA